MDFFYPPMPPGYGFTIAVRALLILWSLVALGVLVHRLRHWKSIQKREVYVWWIAGAVAFVIDLFGYGRSAVYDNNDWVLPIGLAPVSISVCGITIGLCKIYVEEEGVKRLSWFIWHCVIVSGIWLAIVADSAKCVYPQSAAERSRCRHNLSEVGSALHQYCSDHDQDHRFPPFESGVPSMSWRVAILPFLDCQPIYARYDPKQPWNSIANLVLASQQVEQFCCPANYQPRDSAGLWFTAYSMVTGPYTVGADPRGTKYDQISDGTSNTLLLVEACGSQIVWTQPRDVNIQRQPTGINLKGQSSGHSAGLLSSCHPGGVHILLADGSVRFLAVKTDPALLQKLATIDGGEEVDQDY